MLVSRDCPLCGGEALLPFYIVRRHYEPGSFEARVREAAGYTDQTEAVRFLCCQICDTGFVQPIDIEHDPDIY